jgi:hypothetical protein
LCLPSHRHALLAEARPFHHSDWEYPGTGGQDGNIVSGTDSANYLIFLELLKTMLPSGAKISAAVQVSRACLFQSLQTRNCPLNLRFSFLFRSKVWPFAGPDGNPMSDVSAFAKVLDWITIMNYDVWGCTFISDLCASSSMRAKADSLALDRSTSFEHSRS